MAQAKTKSKSLDQRTAQTVIKYLYAFAWGAICLVLANSVVGLLSEYIYSIVAWPSSSDLMYEVINVLLLALIIILYAGGLVALMLFWRPAGQPVPSRRQLAFSAIIAAGLLSSLMFTVLTPNLTYVGPDDSVAKEIAGLFAVGFIYVFAWRVGQLHRAFPQRRP